MARPARAKISDVPAKLGAGGLQEVVEVKLTDDERFALAESAESVRALQAECDAIAEAK